MNPTTRQQRLDRFADGKQRICPSLLNCDFGILAEEIREAERAGADTVHWDVMDGDFCPNFTYGPPIIKSLRPHTQMTFDAHLMVERPGQYLTQFLDAGCDVVTIHLEAEPSPAPILRDIRSAGAWAGLAINPPTPVESVIPWLDEVDLVLIMSVMPGFGGQSFDPSVLPKVKTLLNLKPDLCVEMDGGIGPDTASAVSAAGVRLFVVGSAFYNADNRLEAFGRLERAIASGQGGHG